MTILTTIYLKCYLKKFMYTIYNISDKVHFNGSFLYYYQPVLIAQAEFVGGQI